MGHPLPSCCRVRGGARAGVPQAHLVVVGSFPPLPGSSPLLPHGRVVVRRVHWFGQGTCRHLGAIPGSRPECLWCVGGERQGPKTKTPTDLTTRSRCCLSRSVQLTSVLARGAQNCGRGLLSLPVSLLIAEFEKHRWEGLRQNLKRNNPVKTTTVIFYLGQKCDYSPVLYRVTGKECNLEHLSMFLVK